MALTGGTRQLFPAGESGLRSGASRHMLSQVWEDFFIMKSLRAAILTIGTEVSTGQIINSNASWIADQLVNLKIDPVWHLTVPDVPQEMTAALEVAAARADLILITGGLGPTSDDITRQIVCEWTGDRLQFDEPSWLAIQERFARLGIAVPESNRQQCLFPSSGRIIENPVGSARAFAAEKGALKLWCLPGPPEEIRGIWKHSLGAELAELARGSSGQRLYRWHCLGLSESALAELVEAAIAGSQLTSGYRPHFPYVEVKIWCADAAIASSAPYFAKIEAALKPWLVARDDEDCAHNFLLQLRDYEEVWIDDDASAGALADRLGQAWIKAKLESPRLIFRERFPAKSAARDWPSPPAGVLHLSLGAMQEDGSWTIAWHSPQQRREQSLKMPFKRSSQRADRERRYITEKSLIAWSRDEAASLIATKS